MLYRIIKKNQNKIICTIGQFKFKYFGGSDVVNKLIDFLTAFSEDPHMLTLEFGKLSGYPRSPAGTYLI